MKYDEENWFKVYTRDTAGWLAASWQARGLALEIGRKLPKSTGELSLGRRGLEALASLLRAPWSEIEPYVRELIADGRLEYDEKTQTIRDPQHVERQNTIASGALRTRNWRQRKSDPPAEGDPPVTVRDSRVTPRDASVTRGDAARLEEKKEKKEEKDIGADSAAPVLAHTPAPVSEIKHRRKPETPCPPSGASAGEIRDWCERWQIPDGHGQFVRFLEHHRQNDARFRDWGASWRKWLENVPLFSQPKFNRPGAIVQSGDNRAWKVPEGME